MNIIKRSYRHVSRNSYKTLILFVTMTLILSSFYACISIFKSNENIKEEIYKSSNSYFVISKKDRSQFKKNQLDKIKEIENIKDFNFYNHMNGQLKNLKVIEKEQAIQRDEIPEEFKNLIAVNSVSDSSKDSLFESENFKLIDGRHLDEKDENKIIIHKELADLNKLKVNDQIDVDYLSNNVSSNQKTSKKYTIVGIFEGIKQEENTGLSSDFSENTVYTDYKSSQESLNEKDYRLSKVYYFVKNPEKIKDTMAEVEKLIGKDEFIIEKDDKNFASLSDSIKSTSQIIKFMMIILVLASLAVLLLLYMFYVRERINEIGIYLSLGISKKEILSQLTLEGFMISLPSLLVSWILGNLMVSSFVKGISHINEDIGDISNLLTKSSVFYNLENLIYAYLILILVIDLAVFLALFKLMRRKPREILTQID
ncbi:ABC transporter permease [Anaerococcus sp. Marseille-Q5996]|uniref:ABC transporter permease n=1 Tax=Anaerococcus sp. Marseille-Q5996 TaxID=2972769 RepID=UPI0021C8A710|nr:FtsX-like permease family protein [Anaerococcus sp. Marseille-Q5996]